MKRFVVYFLIASVLGAFFLWLAARELDFDAVMLFIELADPGQMALATAGFVVLYIFCHFSRLWRWLYLVRPLREKLSARLVLRVGAVGFMAILIFPLRLGELVRPYLLSRKADVSMSGVLGTAVVERVVDGLIVTGMLFATLATYEGNVDASATRTARVAGAISAAIFVPALVVCLLAMWRRDWTVGLVRRIGAILRVERITDRLAGLLDAFIEGFRALGRADYLGRFLAFSVLYWALNVASMWFLATYGFGFELTPWQMTAVLSLLVVGIMIPAGPGMAGNFEYFVVQGLALFVLMTPENSGRVGVFAALLHVLQFVIIVLPGLAAMVIDPDVRNLMTIVEEAEDEIPEREV